MTTTAQNVLVTVIANLAPTFFIFFSVGKLHIDRMRQVMAGAIIAESLAMAIKAFLFRCTGYIPVFNRPSEINMRGGRGANNHRRFNQKICPSPDDWHRMTQVAFNTDGTHRVSSGVYADMLIIMAAETPH